MSFSVNSAISSPPATLRTSSPLSELSYYESEPTTSRRRIRARKRINFSRPLHFKAFSTDPSPDMQNVPFLEYCSVYWGVHARKELSDRGKSLALELFKEDYGQISTRLLLAKHYILRHIVLSHRSGDYIAHRSSELLRL